jgi:serine/threonine protein kinase
VQDGTASSDSRPPVSEEEQQTVISKAPAAQTRPKMVAFQASEVGAALEGVELGHFLLEEFVGSGGMGAVFRGLDTTLGRVVAIKVVSSRNADEDTLRRFRNEAQSAARLDHPNIARVYFVGDDKGWNFIAFEFIEGVNARDLVVQRGPLSVADAVRYTLQIADALAHAAERDVVHRDIKPSNILVTQTGRAKLVDMGLARLHQHSSAPTDDITSTGVTLGTFDYISPEQAKDPRNADVRSDLYSLGCTLYYMLTGQPPFPEGTVLQKLLSHSGDSPPDLREQRPGLGDEIAGVTSKLMAKQPAERYQSPRELVADLLLLADQLGLEGIARSSYSTMPADSGWRSRLAWHLPWVVPVSMLILVGAVLHIAWHPSRSAPGDAPTRPRLATAQVPRRGGVESAPAIPPDPAESVSSDQSVGESNRAVRPQASLSVEGDGESVDPSGGGSERIGVGESLPAELNDRRSERMDADLDDFGATPLNDHDAPLEAAADLLATIVVVSTIEQPDMPGELVVPSLELALQKLNELPSIETIELRFQEREEEPFTIDLRRSLTIRAGPGFQPEIVFRPNGGRSLSPQPMVKLMGNHRISFEGLHWQVELPYDLSPEFPEYSLFHLNRVDQITLADCTLTFRNESFAPNASFFSVQAPRWSALADGQNELEPTRSPSIELHRTIARGQATLVRSVEGLPFWLTWDQGLFASTERMVEVHGLVERWGSEVVRLSLTHVTAAMEQGLCRVTIDASGPILPAVFIDCRNCVLTHLAARPLIEHIGVASLAAAQDKLRYVGQHVYYEGTETRWRVQDDSDSYLFAWSDRGGAWHEERFADRVVHWSDEYRLKPSVSAQTPSDYRVDADLRRVAGFDEGSLPVLPRDEPALPIDPVPPTSVPLERAPSERAPSERAQVEAGPDKSVSADSKSRLLVFPVHGEVE